MDLLFVSSRMPYPPIQGDRLRTYHFLRELGTRHRIDLLTLYRHPGELTAVMELKRHCRRVIPVHMGYGEAVAGIASSLFNLRPMQVNCFDSSSLRSILRGMTESHDYDAVHLVMQRMMPCRVDVRRSPVVLDQIDALSLNMTRRALRERNPLMKGLFSVEARLMARYERINRNAWDASIITSAVDRDALTDPEVEVIPNGVDIGHFRPDPPATQDLDLLFTGNMGYYPNVQAMSWFCERVLPLLRAQRPDLRLHVVGAGPSPAIRALADGSRTVVTGFVEDVSTWYRRAKVFVAPLQAGSGIQNKVLEAMASGLPVVASSCANAGIQAREGRELLIADSPQGFVEAILGLLEHPEIGWSMGAAARRFVQAEFSWSARAEALEAVYQRLRSH